MTRIAFVVLFALAQSAFAQQAAQQPAPPPPTPEELAFARLPADLQGILAGLTAPQAMQAISQTNQQLIALGIPRPSPEQYRLTLRNLLGAAEPPPFYLSVPSASAGATTFPPLSPLVAPPPPRLPPPLTRQR